MATTVTVSLDGSVYGRTRTWTSKKWQGFTGHVHVVFEDANNQFMDSTDVYKYGVRIRLHVKFNLQTQHNTNFVTILKTKGEPLIIQGSPLVLIPIMFQYVN